jgi:hypothetical protein
MDKIDKLRIEDIFELKFSANRVYINIPPKHVRLFHLFPGDILRIKIIEVHRKNSEEEIKSKNKELKKSH